MRVATSASVLSVPHLSPVPARKLLLNVLIVTSLTAVIGAVAYYFEDGPQTITASRLEADTIFPTSGEGNPASANGFTRIDTPGADARTPDVAMSPHAVVAIPAAADNHLSAIDSPLPSTHETRSAADRREQLLAERTESEMQAGVARAPQSAIATRQRVATHAEAKATPAPIARKLPLPLAFADIDPVASGLNETQTAALASMREKFLRDIGGLQQNPADPAYAKRWSNARPASDANLRLFFGAEFAEQVALQAAQAEQATASAAH